MSGFGGFLGAAGVGSAIGQAVVQLELNTAKYQAELKAAEGQTAAGTKTMSSSLAAFGGIAKAGLAAGGLAVVAFGAHAISAASDLGEAVNKSNVIFGKNAAEIEKWANTGAEAFGLSKTAALDAAGGFGAMLETAGIATDDLDDMSKSMVQLAGDMASFNNIDPTEALEKLRSGLAGEAEPLRRFGVFLSEAAVQQEAYASGIAETGEELTEAQKVQARYNIIFEQTTKQQGDFARTADSLPNQLRTMKAEFENVSAAVGKQLLPAMTDLLGAVQTLMPLIGFLGLHIVELATALVGLKLATSDATQGIGGFFKALGPGITIASLAVVAGRELNDTFYGTDQAVEEVAASLTGKLEPALESGVISLDQYRAATLALRDPTMGNVEALLEVQNELKAEQIALQDEVIAKEAAKLAADTYVQGLQEQSTVTEDAGRTIHKFAHMTGDALEEWQASTEEAFDSYVLSLEESEDAQADTALGFKAATQDMLQDARALSKAMREIAAEKWVNEEYIKFLSEQGPEWLIGFAELTESQQRKAQAAWQKSTDLTDTAKGSLDKIIGALDDLAGKTTKHRVELHYSYKNFDPSKPGMGGMGAPSSTGSP